MKTLNYDLFTYMKRNRAINEGLVNRLMKSINEIGFIDARPILVNRDHIIIDGQHRFEACKRLKLPIIFEYSNVDMNKAMISLNTNQQIWRLHEYIQSWANDGRRCYIEILEFEEKNKFGISNSITICFGNCSSNRANNIRSGKEFIINPKKDEIASFLYCCKYYFDFWKEKHFVQSIEALFRKTDKTNITKVLNKIQGLRQQATIVDYLNCYENILNKGKKRDENRISLVTSK